MTSHETPVETNTPENFAPNHIKVGIYWYVNGTVIGEAVPLEKAETYGDALQHGGHYEFREKLIPDTSPEKKFKCRAYDYYPRGRMVFFPKRMTARLYVDRCLTPDAIAEVLRFFGHNECRLEIELDEHYQCAGCNILSRL